MSQMHSFITFAAKNFIILCALTALIVWLRLDRRMKLEFVIVGAAAAIFAAALAVIGSNIFNDPRPFVAGHFTPYFLTRVDNGFPSYHTLFGGLLAFLTYSYSHWWGVTALIFAIALGLARVAAGVHHFADIAGALIFAAIGVFIATVLVRKLPKPTQPSMLAGQGK